MLFQNGDPGPQGLKPAFLLVLSGTAEAVPYPKPIYETSSKQKWQMWGRAPVDPSGAESGFHTDLNLV
jgi:hypothetical protein